MASLVERNFYSYLRNIIVGGLDVLLSKNLRTYTILAFFLALTTTMTALFSRPSFDIEIVFAFTLMITSIVFIKSKKDYFWTKLFVFTAFFIVIKSVQPVYAGLLPFAQVSVYATRLLTDLIFFVLIRDFMSSIGGFVLFFGEEKGRVVFRPVFNVIVLASLVGYYHLTSIDYYTAFLGITFALFMFYMINVFAKKKKNNVFVTILCMYYIYFIYQVIAGLTVSTMMGAFVSDLLITLIMFFFIAKTVGIFIGRMKIKRINPENIVLFSLGLVLLFHSVSIGVALGGGVQILFELQQKVSSANIVFITVVSTLFFFKSERFREFMTSLPKKRDVLSTVFFGAIKELFKNK